MSKSCCHVAGPADREVDPAYLRVLWIALVVNTLMFVVEIVSSLGAGSVSLLADAVDFAGDASNYALSLGALATGAFVWRSRAALIKGWVMAVYGIGVLGYAIWSMWTGVVPYASTMGAVAFLALAANLGVAIPMFRFRTGDADMRSLWLCTRNDVLGNTAVLAAAAGVLGTRSGWPDQTVAVLMGGLARSAGITVLRHARQELRAAGPEEAASRLPRTKSSFVEYASPTS